MGFEGPVAISELGRTRCACVPEEAGVYVVLLPSLFRVTFLEVSTGGRPKRRGRRRDPSVSRQRLQEEWVEGASVIYIGRASKTESTDLRKRLQDFIAFGQGRPIGHWGGRLTWQIADASDLLIAWLPTDCYRKTEADMLSEFERQYKALPFANLQRGSASSP
jgi:hypothetical protein